MPTTSETAMPVEASASLGERLREKFTDLTENLRDRAYSVIENTATRLEDFSQRINEAFTPKVESLSSDEETTQMTKLLRFPNFSSIYKKNAAGETGDDRFFSFGEQDRSARPFPPERLSESPIQSYWDFIQTYEPGDLGIREARAEVLSELDGKGIDSKELAENIAIELPTRTTHAFSEACKLQVDIERALVSGKSYEDVKALVDKRNKHGRLIYLMNGAYDNEPYGWAHKGNEEFTTGITTLIEDLSKKAATLRDSGAPAEKIALVNAKIAQLSARLDRSLSYGDVWKYEGYAGSTRMYSKSLREEPVIAREVQNESIGSFTKRDIDSTGNVIGTSFTSLHKSPRILVVPRFDALAATESLI